MNKKHIKQQKIMLGILASIVIISGFTACNNNENPNNNFNNNSNNNSSMSGENMQVLDNKTYNNGGLFVQYKGKTYYREYSNSDIEEGGVWGNYQYNSETKTTKYINAISQNGRVENIFEDNGYGEFYILDDRFFLAGYNKIYSVDMKGESYRDFGKGEYVGADTENHRVYYKNLNNNALYSIDTRTLRITKHGNYILKLIDDNTAYLEENTSLGEIKIFKMDIQTNEISEICTITNEEQSVYYIADLEKYGDILFASIGYDSGSLISYTNSKLYAIDLKDNSFKILDENISRDLVVQKDKVYYNSTEHEDEGSIILKSVNNKSLDVADVSSLTSAVTIENNIIYDNAIGFSYYDEDLNKKEIVTENDLTNFKTKYNVSNEDETYIVQVNNIQLTNNKIYYAIELSKENSNYSIGWRTGYERIATEVYMYDLNKNQNTLLYLYKATDKDDVESGDIYGSGESEEILAENEMYLEIKLIDKGLKETFDIRVEEVGGLIIGKRIEYEGTHSRGEGSLKIKVTKEIGAMLTVYIDGKVDSQMLIEE